MDKLMKLTHSACQPSREQPKTTLDSLEYSPEEDSDGWAGDEESDSDCQHLGDVEPLQHEKIQARLGGSRNPAIERGETARKLWKVGAEMNSKRQKSENVETEMLWKEEESSYKKNEGKSKYERRTSIEKSDIYLAGPSVFGDGYVDGIASGAPEVIGYRRNSEGAKGELGDTALKDEEQRKSVQASESERSGYYSRKDGKSNWRKAGQDTLRVYLDIGTDLISKGEEWTGKMKRFHKKWKSEKSPVSKSPKGSDSLETSPREANVKNKDGTERCFTEGDIRNSPKDKRRNSIEKKLLDKECINLFTDDADKKVFAKENLLTAPDEVCTLSRARSQSPRQSDGNPRCRKDQPHPTIEMYDDNGTWKKRPESPKPKNLTTIAKEEQLKLSRERKGNIATMEERLKSPREIRRTIITREGRLKSPRERKSVVPREQTFSAEKSYQASIKQSRSESPRKFEESTTSAGQCLRPSKEEGVETIKCLEEELSLARNRERIIDATRRHNVYSKEKREVLKSSHCTGSISTKRKGKQRRSKSLWHDNDEYIKCLEGESHSKTSRDIKQPGLKKRSVSVWETENLTQVMHKDANYYEEKSVSSQIAGDTSEISDNALKNAQMTQKCIGKLNVSQRDKHRVEAGKNEPSLFRSSKEIKNKLISRSQQFVPIFRNKEEYFKGLQEPSNFFEQQKVKRISPRSQRNSICSENMKFGEAATILSDEGQDTIQKERNRSRSLFGENVDFTKLGIELNDQKFKKIENKSRQKRSRYLWFDERKTTMESSDNQWDTSENIVDTGGWVQHMECDRSTKQEQAQAERHREHRSQNHIEYYIQKNHLQQNCFQSYIQPDAYEGPHSVRDETYKQKGREDKTEDFKSNIIGSESINILKEYPTNNKYGLWEKGSFEGCTNSEGARRGSLISNSEDKEMCAESEANLGLSKADKGIDEKTGGTANQMTPDDSNQRIEASQVRMSASHALEKVPGSLNRYVSRDVERIPYW